MKMIIRLFAIIACVVSLILAFAASSDEKSKDQDFLCMQMISSGTPHSLAEKQLMMGEFSNLSLVAENEIAKAGSHRI